MIQRFETFTALIARISRNIKRLKNAEMAEYGLKSPHVSCLYYLYSSPGLTATDLCERCGEDKATVSRTLDHLRDMKLILKSGDGTKRYKSPLKLSAKGRDLGGKIYDRVSGILDEVGHGLTEEERINFYRALSVVSDNLDRVGRPAD